MRRFMVRMRKLAPGVGRRLHRGLAPGEAVRGPGAPVDPSRAAGAPVGVGKVADAKANLYGAEGTGQTAITVLNLIVMKQVS